MGITQEDVDLTNLFSLKGKVAIVTGASGGLGSNIARGLAAFGADLVIVGRNQKRLSASKSQIVELGRRVLALEADLTSPQEVESIVARSVEAFGTVNMIVNAHGINIRRPSDSMTIEEWEKVMDANLKSVFLCCQAAGREMIKRKSGKIVNISSVAAKIGYDKGYAAYSPSKAGVEALTRTLASEWGKYTISVNAVAPFFIRTAITADVLSNNDFYEWVLSGIPMKRLGTPSDVVGAVVFLCSRAADWISGQVICIDGGRSIT